jgi:hypothetical protein
MTTIEAWAMGEWINLPPLLPSQTSGIHIEYVDGFLCYAVLVKVERMKTCRRLKYEIRPI